MWKIEALLQLGVPTLPINDLALIFQVREKEITFFL
jgi:hypothetical protein